MREEQGRLWKKLTTMRENIKTACNNEKILREQFSGMIETVESLVDKVGEQKAMIEELLGKVAVGGAKQAEAGVEAGESAEAGKSKEEGRKKKSERDNIINVSTNPQKRSACTHHDRRVLSVECCIWRWVSPNTVTLETFRRSMNPVGGGLLIMKLMDGFFVQIFG